MAGAPVAWVDLECSGSETVVTAPRVADLAEVRAVVADAREEGHPGLRALVAREAELAASLAADYAYAAFRALQRIAPGACAARTLESAVLMEQLVKAWQAIGAVDIEVSVHAVSATATRGATVGDFGRLTLHAGDRFCVLDICKLEHAYDTQTQAELDVGTDRAWREWDRIRWRKWSNDVGTKTENCAGKPDPDAAEVAEDGARHPGFVRLPRR